MPGTVLFMTLVATGLSVYLIVCSFSGIDLLISGLLIVACVNPRRSYRVVSHEKAIINQLWSDGHQQRLTKWSFMVFCTVLDFKELVNEHLVIALGVNDLPLSYLYLCRHRAPGQPVCSCHMSHLCLGAWPDYISCFAFVVFSGLSLLIADVVERLDVYQTVLALQQSASLLLHG